MNARFQKFDGFLHKRTQCMTAGLVAGRDNFDDGNDVIFTDVRMAIWLRF